MSKKAARGKRIKIILAIILISIVTYAYMGIMILGYMVDKSIREMHESASLAVRSASEVIDDEKKLVEAYEEAAQCKRDAIAWLMKKGRFNEKELKERYALDDKDDSGLENIQDKNADRERIAASVTVGSSGFLMFINTKEGTVVAYPEEEMNGRTGYVVTSNDLPLDNGGSIRTDYIVVGDESYGIDVLAAFRIQSGLDFIDNDPNIVTYIATDIGEACVQAAVMAWNLWLVFGAVVYVAMQYSKYSLMEKNKEYGQFRQWLVSMVPVGCVLVMIISFIIYTLMGTTYQFSFESRHSKRIGAIIGNYEDRKSSLEEWYSNENLIKCRMAADMVGCLGEDADSESVREISEIIKAINVYRYDSNGKVTLTDAPYENIVLTTDPTNPDYVFRSLLKGVDSVVQEISVDDMSGESLQYIGVGIRNDNDKVDGFVQICVSAETLDTLIKGFSIKEEVKRVGIGSQEISLFIDRESKEILYSSEEALEGKLLENTGIANLTLKDMTNGILNFGYISYLYDISELEDGFLLLLVPESTATAGRVKCSIFLAAVTLISILIIIFISLFRYKKLQEEERKRTEAEEEKKKKEEEKEKAKEEPQETEHNEWGLFVSVSQILGDKNGKSREAFEERWNQHKKPKSELTSEERIGGTIRMIMFALSLYVVGVLFIGLIWGNGGNTTTADDSVSVMDYLLYGNWDKGFNIFSVTMCALIICISISLIGIFNRLLYSIARVSNTRIETICMLLRSSNKYLAAILIVYLCVGQFVENATTLFATTGVISVVIGIGAKDLIGDIIAGFFLVFENAFNVGDYISVDGWMGVVTNVGIRMTTLTSYADTRIINNSDLRKIINMNSGNARSMIKVALSYEEDLEKVEELLKQELPTWKDRIPGAVYAPYYGGVDHMEYNAVYINIGCYCTSLQRWGAERALNREIKLLFEKHGIKTAYELVYDNDNNPVMPMSTKNHKS